jgi:16S rRNA (guanine(1405)-N(7))-methyltransferase
VGGSDEAALRTIEQALTGSRRYAAVAPQTVRRIARRSLTSAQGDVAEAIKRTKRGLHEIYGAYLPAGAPGYPALLRRIAAADPVEDGLRAALSVHASTRERLPYLRDFYAAVFEDLRPASVRDLACGLNPLAIPWMGLPAGVTYQASDIDSRQMEFVGSVLELLGVRHRAVVHDLVGAPPAGSAEVTLLLKTVPCLERQQQGAGWALLDAVVARPPGTDAGHVVASFPTRSLGRRAKGMFQTYSAAFEAHAAERSWSYRRVEIPTELVYVISG